MQQLTRDRKTFLRWGQKAKAQVATVEDEAVYTHEGVEYKILPLTRFNQILSHNWKTIDVAWFSAGIAIVALCGGYVIAGEKPPSIIEKIVTVDKPIVIEKPTPVNSGCLAFCNR